LRFPFQNIFIQYFLKIVSVTRHRKTHPSVNTPDKLFVTRPLQTTVHLNRKASILYVGLAWQKACKERLDHCDLTKFYYNKWSWMHNESLRNHNSESPYPLSFCSPLFGIAFK